jgi:hypothetical protein
MCNRQNSTLANRSRRVVRIKSQPKLENLGRGVRTPDRGCFVSTVPVLEVMEQGSVWGPCKMLCQGKVGDTEVKLRWRVGPHLIAHIRVLKSKGAWLYAYTPEKGRERGTRMGRRRVVETCLYAD